MCITIREIDSLYWNQELLNHLVKYGKGCYDFRYSEEQFKNEYRLIENGEPNVLDSKSEYHRVFEIVLNDADQLVGTITLNRVETNNWEIDVGVFEKYQNNGFAKKAVQFILSLLKQEGEKIVEARIRIQNPGFKKVVALFQNIGFTIIEKGILNTLLIYELN